MLILTRRVGETLVIGDNVKITVLGVKGNQVRVGVDAPKEVSIQRARWNPFRNRFTGRFRITQTLLNLRKYRRHRRPQRRTLPAQRHRIALSRRTP